MDRLNFYKILAVSFLLAILFTPQGSNIWFLFLAPGLIFGFLWFKKLG